MFCEPPLGIICLYLELIILFSFVLPCMCIVGCIRIVPLKLAGRNIGGWDCCICMSPCPLLLTTCGWIKNACEFKFKFRLVNMLSALLGVYIWNCDCICALRNVGDENEVDAAVADATGVIYVWLFIVLCVLFVIITSLLLGNGSLLLFWAGYHCWKLWWH